MTKPLESKLEQDACQYALSFRVVSLKLDKIKRNWPDRGFFLPRSKLLLIEFKREGEEPRPAQLAGHKYLNELGHFVHVIDELSAFKQLFLQKFLGQPWSSEDLTRRMCQVFPLPPDCL